MSSAPVFPSHGEVALSFSQWKDRVQDEYVQLELETDSTGVFRGGLAVFGVGEITFGDIVHDPLQVRRTSELLADSTRDFYKISVQLEGYSVIEQDGRETAVSPGDLTMYDTARPFTLTTNDTARALIISCPHELIGVPAELITELTATRLSGRSGLGGIASTMLVNVERGLDQGSVRPTPQLESSVLSVLRAVLAEHAERIPTAAGDEHTFARVQMYIDDHLADPHLAVSDIAAAHFVSARQLQRLFQSRGTTVTQWIRDRRLEKCRQELADTDAAAGSVRDVALRWGIQDAAHFSRIFRSVFGKTPTEYRIESRATPYRD